VSVPVWGGGGGAWTLDTKKSRLVGKGEGEEGKEPRTRLDVVREIRGARRLGMMLCYYSITISFEHTRIADKQKTYIRGSDDIIAIITAHSIACRRSRGPSTLSHNKERIEPQCSVHHDLPNRQALIHTQIRCEGKRETHLPLRSS
jgi:hypothetical protein